nr:hypothetical protein [uncultured Acetatifactor sp.]
MRMFSDELHAVKAARLGNLIQHWQEGTSSLENLYRAEADSGTGPCAGCSRKPWRKETPTPMSRG